MGKESINRQSINRYPEKISSGPIRFGNNPAKRDGGTYGSNPRSITGETEKREIPTIEDKLARRGNLGIGIFLATVLIAGSATALVYRDEIKDKINDLASQDENQPQSHRIISPNIES